MLHNAYIYIAIVRLREIMHFFIHAKSSSQMLNTFEKTKAKKRNVIFYKDNN